MQILQLDNLRSKQGYPVKGFFVIVSTTGTYLIHQNHVLSRIPMGRFAGGIDAVEIDIAWNISLMIRNKIVLFLNNQLVAQSFITPRVIKEGIKNWKEFGYESENVFNLFKLKDFTEQD